MIQHTKIVQDILLAYFSLLVSCKNKSVSAFLVDDNFQNLLNLLNMPKKFFWHDSDRKKWFIIRKVVEITSTYYSSTKVYVSSMCQPFNFHHRPWWLWRLTVHLSSHRTQQCHPIQWEATPGSQARSNCEPSDPEWQRNGIPPPLVHNLQ